MSLTGHPPPNFDVRVRSAFHLIATKSRTSRHFGFEPKRTHALQQKPHRANNLCLAADMNKAQSILRRRLFAA